VPPPTTAHGGLVAQLSRHPDDYQPSNITFSHVLPYVASPGPNGKVPRLAKRAKYEAMAQRALSDLADWAGLERAAPESPAGVVAATL
jgi:methylenetetrahydrofolate--tRNA-(uracil-5-)-methyltransferase